MNIIYILNHKYWFVGFSSILSLVTIVLLISCGEDYSPKNNDVDLNSGTHVFALTWPTSSPELSNSLIAPSEVDCDAVGIVNIVARYYDIDNNLLNDPPDVFACHLHYGKVKGLPPGNNYRLLVAGENHAGEILYQGEETGINIVAGSITNSGDIPMVISSPVNVLTTGGDTQVTLSWDFVSGSEYYNIYYATDSSVSKTYFEGIINNVTSTSYIHTGLTNGTLYYYVVTAENNLWEGPESEAVSVKPGISWTRLLGSQLDERGQSIAVDLNGNAYITGFTAGDLEGSGYWIVPDDAFISKYDTNGNNLWTKQLYWEQGEAGYSVSVDSDSNLYIVGAAGDVDGNPDIYLAKYDTNGNRQWMELIGEGTVNRGYGISVDTNSNSYIVGITNGNLDGNTNFGNWDVFVSKYDTNGNKQWAKLLGTSYNDYGEGISVDSSGNSYIVGYTKGDMDGNTNTGGFDIFISKYDTNGNKQWTKLLGSVGDEQGYGISVDSDRNSYITGFSEGNLDDNSNSGANDIFISKYDTNGNKQWTKLIGTENNDHGEDITVDSNGNIYVTGATEGNLNNNTNVGSKDIFICKYDTNGNRQWTKLLGTEASDISEGVAIDSEDKAFLTGYTEGDLSGRTNSGGVDIFIMKVPGD